MRTRVGLVSGSQFSPNGRFVAHCSEESGTTQVYVRSFPEGGRKWQVSQDGGKQPRWGPGGTELFYEKEDTLYAATVTTEGAFSLGSTTKLFSDASLDWPFDRATYDVSHDGQRFITIDTIGEVAKPRMRIVQNWFVGFGRQQDR